MVWITLLRADSTILNVDFHSTPKQFLIWLLEEWISTPVHLESTNYGFPLQNEVITNMTLRPRLQWKKSRAEHGLVFTVNAQNAKRGTKNGCAFGRPLGPGPARPALGPAFSHCKRKPGQMGYQNTKRLLCMNAHSHFTHLLDSKQWKLLWHQQWAIVGYAHSAHGYARGAQNITIFCALNCVPA